MNIQNEIEEMGARFQARVLGHPIAVLVDDEGLTLQDYSGDWTIHVCVDPEAQELCYDEPFARPALNSSGAYRDTEMGEAVDRAFSGTSIEAHERMVLRWLNTYRATQQGVAEEPARLYDEDATAPAYAEHEETDHAALTGIYDGTSWSAVDDGYMAI